MFRFLGPILKTKGGKIATEVRPEIVGYVYSPSCSECTSSQGKKERKKEISSVSRKKCLAINHAAFSCNLIFSRQFNLGQFRLLNIFFSGFSCFSHFYSTIPGLARVLRLLVSSSDLAPKKQFSDGPKIGGEKNSAGKLRDVKILRK